MKKILLITILSSFMTACFDENEGRDIDPETMNDCIAIENPNNRDICAMKMNEKLKGKKLKSIGPRNPKPLDW